ncbi:MAG: hypothetical protein ABI402_18160 [Ferruginibacter sp.]
MKIITEIKIAVKEPSKAMEILVYHSGDTKYITAIKRRIGKPNKQAIGIPLVNLLMKPLSFSFTRSQ